MDSGYKYQWKTSRIERVIPESEEFSGKNEFFIQIQVKEYLVIKNLHQINGSMIKNDDVDDDNKKGVFKELLSPVKVKNVAVRKDPLLSKEDETLACLSYFLREMGVPAVVLCSTIDAITSFAKMMADTDPHDQDVLAMRFEFSSSITEVSDEN